MKNPPKNTVMHVPKFNNGSIDQLKVGVMISLDTIANARKVNIREVRSRVLGVEPVSCIRAGESDRESQVRGNDGRVPCCRCRR